MSGLTNTVEITRDGRTLISKLMKGVASSGISHVAVGSGVGGAYSPFGTNSRVGNNFEMTGIEPIIIHNDFPVYNFGPNGVLNSFYFIQQANNQADITLSFGSSATGGNVLQQNNFNHLWLIHTGTSGPYGIGDILNIPTGSAAIPPTPSLAITYIGCVECDGNTTPRSFTNPARMFNELGRTTSMTIDYLGDRSMRGVTPAFNSLTLDITTVPNPSVLVRAPFSLGLTNTIREIAIFGNSGNDMLAWGPLTAGTPITPGQGIFILWGLGF